MDVLSIFNKFNLLWLPISDAMGDRGVVIVNYLVSVFGIPVDLPTECKDDELQGITRDFSVEPED